MLVTIIYSKDDLGPDVNTKGQSLEVAPAEDYLSATQLADIAQFL